MNEFESVPLIWKNRQTDKTDGWLARDTHIHTHIYTKMCKYIDTYIC